ncbi:MAG: PAS domain S-box protein [Candidatus Thermoplasmatota archaeon]
MSDATGGRKAMLVLLVDDDAAYLEVLKFFLEREGAAECEMATSARQALDLLAQGEYDAVVSDYLMPDMDGLELLKIVRLQGKDVPFIMLTGRGREDVAIEALNNGADFYVQKGGDPKTQFTDLTNMLRRSVMQRRAEREVQEGERFLGKLFESIQDGVSVVNRDMVIERVNPAMERWYPGSAPLVGKRCYEAYRSRSSPCPVCPVVNTFKSGRPCSQRLAKMGPDGEDAGWLEVHSFPVIDGRTGEVEQVIEYLRDVTEQEAAKDSSQMSELRYRALTDIASDGVLAVDRAGKIVFSSPRVTEILGYLPEEVVGAPFQSLVDREWLSGPGSGALHKALEGRERIEMRFARKDGTRADVVVSSSPVSSDRGVFDGAIVAIADVGGLRAAARGITFSEDSYTRVFQTSPQMIMIARVSDSAILEANDSFAKATGYAHGQMVGRSFKELGIVSEDLAARIERALVETGLIFDMEAVMHAASGKDIPVRLSAYRLRLEGEECSVFLSCDISLVEKGSHEMEHERDVLKAVLESAPDGILIASLDGTIVECNAAFRSLLGGIPKEHLVGRSAYALLGESEAALAKRIEEKLVHEGMVRGVGFTFNRSDGISVDAEVSAALVRGARGKPLYYVAAVRDMTDEKRYRVSLEKALSERRQMEAIIESSQAVAIRWLEEPGWPVDYVSENVRKFGYEAAELTSGAVEFPSIIHPDDRDRVVAEAGRFLEQGSDEFEQEYRIVSPEGKVAWIYDRTTVLRRPDGSVEACQGVLVDVTEMRDALDRLSRTESQLALFMDYSPVMKFMKDRSGRYVYVNRKLCEAVGISPEEWLGKTDLEIFTPETAKGLADGDRTVFETRQFGLFNEVIPMKGRPREFLTYKFLVPNTAGGDDLLAGVSVDLTEERSSERALRAANDKLELLGSMTRHDIANQLAVLTARVEIARMGETDPVRLASFNEMLASSNAIQGLLNFASEYQEIGSREPAWIPVRLAFAAGVIGLPMQGVRADVDVGGLEVFADPMFERVFRNLVDNSLRHGEKVSRVRLSARPDGKDVVLVYEDDGVGLSAEAKARVFEKGFGRHTGLGMFMVRGVLALTGMEIRETGEEGSGARFEIRVPEGRFRDHAGKG